MQKALNTNANYADKSVAWRKGEMEFEAWMRMLDSQVIHSLSWMSSSVSFYVLEEYTNTIFWPPSHA